MEPCNEIYEEDEEDEEEEEESENNQMDFSDEEAIAMDSDLLIDRLDILLANGLLSSQSKSTIKSAVDQLDEPSDRVKMATYLIMISPDYAILK